MSAENTHLPQLQKRVDKAPLSPGVYRWKDSSGTVLYIGKAKNLKKRLQSYVTGKESEQGPWKRSLVKQIADFDITVTQSELEALVMETNWIKEHKPKYNVLMKDDKNYVYVRISIAEKYPRIEVTRQMEQDSAKYFGPYLKAWGIKRTLDMLDSLYRFRSCKQSLDMLNKAGSSNHKQKACLEYQIGKCNGLCIGELDEQEYTDRIEHVLRFLRGDRKDATILLREKMQQAAHDKKFELAATLRDTLQYIESLEEKQVVSDTSGANTDAIGVCILGTKAQVVVLRERNGKLIDERSMALQGEADEAMQILEQFIPQYYSVQTDIPDTVLVGIDTPERELLEALLTQLKEKKVEIHIPERGKKSHLLSMAEQNAEQKIREQLARFEAAARSTEEGLTELERILELPESPKRIEGYDISHLGGTETVGSMVVMKNGKPANDQYRSFTIRTVQEGDIDDYKAMKEVLTRRLLHIKNNPKTLEEQWKEKGVVAARARKTEQSVVNDLSTEELDYKRAIVARIDKEIIGYIYSKEHTEKLIEITHEWLHKDYTDKALRTLLIQKILGTLKVKVYIQIHKDDEEYMSSLGFRHVLTPPEELPLQTDKQVYMYDPKQHKVDASLTSTPDLLVIDGGKGQLNAVVEVLQELDMILPIVGLAKREEEVFMPGEKVPRLFPKESQGKYMLMRLRDEAHRFANRHRTTRKKKADIRSALDDVPGIGPALKQKLLEQFGSVQGVQSATDQELLTILNTTQVTAIRKVLR